MKQRGSALIIAMMFIGLIGAVAFGIAKLIFADTSINTLSENGAIAYYAAESGVEEGFLRYRYNQNAEVPFATDWVFNGNNVFRADLTASPNTVNTNITSADLVTASANQIYDLRMGYLGTYHSINNTYLPIFGHKLDGGGSPTDTPWGIPGATDIFNSAYSTGDYSFLRIPKDEARTFDLSNIDFSDPTSNNLAVGFKFIGVGIVANGGYLQLRQCQAMAEVTFLVNGDTPAIAKEYKALTVFDKEICASELGIDQNKLDEAWPASFTAGGWNQAAGTYRDYTNHDNTDYYYSLNTILSDVLTKAGATLHSTDKVSMTVKPLYYSADVAFAVCVEPSFVCSDLSSRNHSNVVTGPYTYMTSIGYYGGTTRTLTANIDRQSGTLYDLYDYVLYKEN